MVRNNMNNFKCNTVTACGKAPELLPEDGEGQARLGDGEAAVLVQLLHLNVAQPPQKDLSWF
jgi:hypothetical protein